MIDQRTHRRIMYELIKDIFSLPYNTMLAFKGGTACYFLHSLDRFSTDIDLDILSHENHDSIYDDIAALASKHGAVKHKKHLILSYKKGYDHIKIDLSRKIRNTNTYETVNFYGTDIQVQDRATMFANKLVAATERTVNRDLYDIYFMFTHDFPINEAVLYERTGKSLHDLYQVLIDKIQSLGVNHKILDGLGEVLDTEKKTFVKNKLLSELLGMLEMMKKF